MPLFEYKGRSKSGEPVNGQVEAGDQTVVANQLLGAGITPVLILEITPKQDILADIRKLLPPKKVNLDELILFSRQMYSLLKAGVPITRAINGLVDTTKNPTLRLVLKEMVDDLESGRPLSNSMAKYPKVFSSLFVSMLNVGENTGKLDESFLQMSRYLELEKDTRNRIKSAMRYPTFVIVAIVVAISIINLFVIPAFSKMFASFGADLPWATQVLVGMSAFFVNWWPAMLAAVVIAVVGTKRYIDTDDGHLKWDRSKLHLPVVGSIIMRATLARFARSFAMASHSGVPLLQALNAVSRAVDNVFVGAKITSMREGIERGDSLSRTARQTELFTPLVLQMIAVGEETGAVDDLLLEVAEYYEREVDYELKYLSDSIEPILIIVVGILVLILALGVFLPMWELGSVAK